MNLLQPTIGNSLDGWYRGKASLKEKTGFSFGIDYTTVMMIGFGGPMAPKISPREGLYVFLVGGNCSTVVGSSTMARSVGILNRERVTLMYSLSNLPSILATQARQVQRFLM